MLSLLLALTVTATSGAEASETPSSAEPNATTTATTTATDEGSGGGLFSDETVPDKVGRGGGLFSDETVPDEAGGGLFSSDEIPDVADADADAQGSGGDLYGGGSEPPPFEPRIRAGMSFEALTALDTAFDRDGENVFELQLSGRATLDADIAEGLSIYAAPTFTHQTGIRKDGTDREFVVLQMPEAYVTYGHGRTYLRLGTQIFNWGSSDFSAPADILNPVDLRRGLVAGTPEQTKIPVFAAELVTGTGPFTFRAVLEPFFTPSRFFLTGWDDSLLSIAGANGFAFPDISEVLGAPTADQIGDQALLTGRPADRIDNATLGGRATYSSDNFDASITAIYGWEQLPRFYIDPNAIVLADRFLGSIANGQPIDPLSDPDLLRAFEALNLAMAQGQPIFEGEYLRRALVGADAVIALDPIVLKLDVAYSFARTLYAQDNFRAIRRPWLNAVLGLEYTSGEDFQILVEAFALTVFDVKSNERVQLIEPNAPPPSVMDIAGAERTVAMPGIIGVVRYNLLEGDLQLEAVAVSTVTRGDFIFLPAIRYRIDDQQQVSLSALIIEGKVDGYGGFYSHNDRLQVGYKWSL